MSITLSDAEMLLSKAARSEDPGVVFEAASPEQLMGAVRLLFLFKCYDDKDIISETALSVLGKQDLARYARILFDKALAAPPLERLKGKKIWPEQLDDLPQRERANVKRPPERENWLPPDTYFGNYLHITTSGENRRHFRHALAQWFKSPERPFDIKGRRYALGDLAEYYYVGKGHSVYCINPAAAPLLREEMGFPPLLPEGSDKIALRYYFTDILEMKTSDPVKYKTLGLLMSLWTVEQKEWEIDKKKYTAEFLFGYFTNKTIDTWYISKAAGPILLAGLDELPMRPRRSRWVPFSLMTERLFGKHRSEKCDERLLSAATRLMAHPERMVVVEHGTIQDSRPVNECVRYFRSEGSPSTLYFNDDTDDFLLEQPEIVRKLPKNKYHFRSEGDVTNRDRHSDIANRKLYRRALIQILKDLRQLSEINAVDSAVPLSTQDNIIFCRHNGFDSWRFDPRVEKTYLSRDAIRAKIEELERGEQQAELDAVVQAPASQEEKLLQPWEITRMLRMSDPKAPQNAELLLADLYAMRVEGIVRKKPLGSLTECLHASSKLLGTRITASAINAKGREASRSVL